MSLADSGRQEIYRVLTHDQCVNGFENTTNAIALWLVGCDKMGRKELIKRLQELDVELDGFGS